MRSARVRSAWSKRCEHQTSDKRQDAHTTDCLPDPVLVRERVGNLATDDSFWRLVVLVGNRRRRRAEETARAALGTLDPTQRWRGKRSAQEACTERPGGAQVAVVANIGHPPHHRSSLRS